MLNSVEIQGTLMNIQAHTGSKGTLVLGWLNQRDVSRLGNGDMDRTVYVAGINIVALDPSAVQALVGLDKARQGQKETQLVTLKGRLKTKFDNREGIEESKRSKPQVQLEVYEVVTE